MERYSGNRVVAGERGPDRVDSTRLDDRAGQQTSIDVDVFLSWLKAVSEEKEAEGTLGSGQRYEPVGETLSVFFFERMREEFKPALEAWIDTGPLVDDDAPPTTFVMDGYIVAAAVEAQDKLTEAEGHTDAALAASQNSDNHVLTAVALALAVAIFFSGVSSKLAAFRNQQLALVLSAVIYLGAGIVLAFLPKVAPVLGRFNRHQGREPLDLPRASGEVVVRPDP